MTRPKQHRHHDRKVALYQRFLGELGIETPELQRLFGEEITRLSAQDFAVYRDSNFFAPDTWTDEQIRVFRKMLARAAAKVKRQNTTP